MPTSLSILIVEDDPGAAAVTAAIMTKAGHKGTVAENGAVALHLVHQEGHHYDVVIMEAEIPVMGGIEAARFLRENHSTANIPIVGFSALEVVPEADVNVAKGCRSAELLGGAGNGTKAPRYFDKCHQFRAEAAVD